MNESETTWLSPIKIMDSSLLSLSFSTHPRCQDEDGALSFTLDVKFDEPEQGDEVVFCVGVVKFDGEMVEGDEGEAASAFAISCALGIAVEVDNRVLRGPLEDYAGQIKANALALAYGKIRAIVENITAQSMLGKQTIPAINAQAYFGQSEQNA